MEKYSQFRDRSTGIAPFLPITTPLSFVATITHSFIFLFRLPFFLTYALSYFVLFNLLPLPVFVRKVALWGLMAIPGIWWIDLQLDGVKRGRLSEQPRDRFPHPGSVIAANFTSPIDAIYLAAIFDPIFVVSYPGSREVSRVGLLGAVMQALAPVHTKTPANAKPTTLTEILATNPNRIIVVFPECGTTNGKAILPLCPNILELPSDVHIFPVSIRYTPSDVTTPVPGQWFRFLWNLLSRPTTCIRVRVAEGQKNHSTAPTNGIHSSDTLRDRSSTSARDVSADEQKVLDRIAEALARLSRVKRVGLTMQDKQAFVTALKTKKS
ncbi:vacuolar protein sorting protein [Sarocladium implicatum]|nr:vacuolar protein sorting protein [Sarocladium implicatum]